MPTAGRWPRSIELSVDGAAQNHIISPELAALGRQVLRDHCQYGKWNCLLSERSDGPAMLALCLANPSAPRARFEDKLGPNRLCRSSNIWNVCRCWQSQD